MTMTSTGNFSISQNSGLAQYWSVFQIIPLLCHLTIAMPNPSPAQSTLFKQKRFRRTVEKDSCVPADITLAQKEIAVKLPTEVDQALRALGTQKAAWLPKAICQAALDDGLVNQL